MNGSSLLDDDPPWRPYHELPGLADYHFECSYVLGVDVREHELTVTLEVVLESSHPSYRTPPAATPHCWRRAVLHVRHIRRLTWVDPLALRPSVDASGETDYGDLYLAWREGQCRLQSDHGLATIEGDVPVVELMP